MFVMQAMVSVQYMKVKRINKKGISPVVATVALIMITVAAAVFIAGFVIPFQRHRDWFAGYQSVAGRPD